jgi:serpin B
MRFLKAASIACLMVSCGQDYADIASSAARDTSPSDADVPELTKDEADFAFDLYRAKVGADASSNVFFSPYSISVALAMTYAGAGGDTAAQIASAMHFTLPPDRLHAAFDALDLALASREDVKLAIANSVWGQRTLGYGPAFLDTLAVDYGSEVRGVDFIHDSAQATNTINTWVSGETNGKIQNLFQAGALDASTRVVLVNAIYFDAGWNTPFDPQGTTPSTFTKNDGSTVTVPMMHEGLAARVAFEPTYTAADIPYAGGKTSMLVIMPADGQFAAIESSLTGDFLAQVVASLSPSGGGGTLGLPKLELDGKSFSLKPALQALGVADAFTPLADFSPMVTSEKVAVADVVHQAYVRVDENGTEAAAATAVATADAGVSGGPAPKNVIVDHPFFFVLRDIPTGAVLFVGRVLDPTATTI